MLNNNKKNKNNKFADHFTTSAKTGDGINEVVRQVAKNVRV